MPERIKKEDVVRRLATRMDTDETSVRVKGKWWDFSHAIDADGNLVDSRLSEKRDMEAAQKFFKQALTVVGHTPERVTTDGHASYPRAVRKTLGD